jgi:hypothetical protein
VGLLDFLTATKHAPAGVSPLPQQEVRARLLSLNRSTAPYRLIDGGAERVDLIAEWKIEDPEWRGVFAGTNLPRTFRIYLKLDPAAHEVRAMDREYAVSWSAGVPTLSVAVSTFRGQTRSVEFGKTYTFTETLAPGQVYSYRFDTNEIKKPIQEAVTSCGWTYRGVAFGKL